MSMINRESLLAAYDAGHQGSPGMARKLIEEAPTIDAVPIKPLCTWLAAYAAPPLYASDHVAVLKNKVSIKTETERAEAWEYHWKNLMECGLIGE